MRYLSGIFWGLSWYVFTINLSHSEFLVCLSVCLLAYFLNEIMSIWGYIQFWMRYHSEFFLRHSWDISALFPKYSVFLVCLSVCLSVSYISSNWSFLGVNFWDLWSCFLSHTLTLWKKDLQYSQKAILHKPLAFTDSRWEDQ